MGTKKKAKAEPVGTPAATDQPVLAVGMIWTDPRDGQKYNVVEASGKVDCKGCHFFDTDADCPESDSEGTPVCEGSDDPVKFEKIAQCALLKVWPTPNEHGVYSDEDAEAVAFKFKKTSVKIRLLQIEAGWTGSLNVQSSNGGNGGGLSEKWGVHSTRDIAYKTELIKLQEYALHKISQGRDKTEMKAVWDWAQEQVDTLKSDEAPAAHTAPAADFGKVPKVKKGKAKDAPATIEGLTKRQMDIPQGDIQDASWNTRGKITAASVADLVASIKAVGLLNRVTVYKFEDADKYQVLAGHRRLTACRLLGMTDIPCEVVDCDQRTGMLITCMENLNRTDLTVMQEATMVETLLKQGFTAEEVAEKTGKHLRWVYRRASIRKLTAKWRKEANDRNLCAAFLEEISRLPTATQDGILADVDEYDSDELFMNGGNLEEIRNRANYIMHRVDRAPWAKKHPELCGNCQSCTGTLGDLFDAIERTDGELCLDPVCWEKRHKDWVTAQQAELEAKHGECRTVANNDKWRLTSSGDAKNKKDAGHTVPVLVTDGDAIGTTLWVAPKGAEKAAAESRGETVKPHGPTLAQKRMAWVIKKVDGMLDVSKTERPCPFENMGENAVIRAVTQFGTHWNQRGADGTDWEELSNGSIDGVVFNLWTQVMPVLKMRMSFQTIMSCESAYDEAVACAAWAFSLTKEDLDAEAAEAIKDKSKKGAQI